MWGILEAAVRWVERQVQRFVDWCGRLIARIMPVVETVREAVAPVVETVREAVAPVVEAVREAVAPVVEAVAPVVEVAREMVRAGVNRCGVLGEVLVLAGGIGVAILVGSVLPIWLQIPLGWGLGWVVGRWGLGAMLLACAVFLPQMTALGLAGYLASLLLPNYGVDDEVRPGMRMAHFGAAAVFAVFYVFIGRLFQRTVALTALLYGLVVLISALRAGDQAWEAVLTLGGLFLVMLVLHAWNIPIMALFATFYCARLFFRPERVELSDPEVATHATFISSFIPGMNGNFLSRVIYGHRTTILENNTLEPALEWSAALSFLFAGVADGKTVLGAYLDTLDPTTTIVTILASLLLSLGVLSRQDANPPQPAPRSQPPHTATTRSWLQFLAACLATAAINPLGILLPLIATPVLYWLYTRRETDAQVFCIPAFTAAAAVA